MRRILNHELPSQTNGDSRIDKRKSYNVPFDDTPEIDLSALHLPSKEYVAHLAGIANFHLHSIHLLFDHGSFLEQFDSIFPPSPQPLSKLQYSRFLLIIAVGKLFLEKGASESGPPGVDEFLQGANALPPIIVLSRDPLTAVETLCLLAFYAQAADLHELAFLYVC